MAKARPRNSSKAKTAPKSRKPAKVSSYREIPIADLGIERFQARKQNVGESLEELASSIEKYGLLQPIVVCKSAQKPGKWEVVCGQRRYLAHKQILKWPNIMAAIIDHTIEYDQGLALSASENIHRLDMTRKDLIDLCNDLYKRYETIKDVVEQTKLPFHVVRRYIRFDALPPDLKEKVNAKEINVDLAVKVQDAASAAGSYDRQEAKKMISVLKTVDNPVQKKIIELRKKNPGVPLERIVKKAEEPDQTLKLQITLLEEVAKPLRKYAEDEDTDPRTAAEGFIETCLRDNGYMNVEE